MAMKMYWFWPWLNRVVNDYVERCFLGQTNKAKHVKKLKVVATIDNA